MKKSFGEGIALGVIIGVSVSMVILVTVVLPEYKRTILESENNVPKTGDRKPSSEYTMTDKNTIVTFKTKSHEVYR